MYTRIRYKETTRHIIIFKFFIFNNVFIKCVMHGKSSEKMVWKIVLYIHCFYWLMNKSVLASGLAE